MGKLTEALRKAADERLERIEKINKLKTHDRLVIKKMGDSKVDPRVITYFDPKSPISEQYKILRTNVLSLNKIKTNKAIVITSAINTEGKTVTTLNLSMTIAQSAQPKVLVIDADMRRGRIARYLGVEHNVGLSDVLQGKATLEEAVFKIDVENLNFIASGPVPENPAELLDSQEMKNFLGDLKRQFDYIIIDTPPIIAVTDSGILGAQVDGVIMVIQAGRTQRGIIKRASELLHQCHAKVLGHVLTNIEYHLPQYIYRYL
ncbi:MAG TPA: CpsD/CapB family tyrosine-protein kinase [Candidatus Omnitrophota bacterium]|nr:CpsD/CapB family tyrosine-protein kinase [Candidatus Omnitrophota bacterium]